jgi:predicted nucleic acid-binding protein
MILLDTDVLSAVMRKAGDPPILRWLDRVPAESIWTTAVTVFEIRFGLELLVPGRRRAELEAAFTKALDEVLDGRVLSFDAAAAHAAGGAAAALQRSGRGIEIRDMQIAGIALSRRATLATRNVKHFQRTGVDLVDPWAA